MRVKLALPKNASPERKQTLLAYMNGALPQVAIEFGRKTISAYERPSIDAVEQSTMNTGAVEKKAA